MTNPHPRMPASGLKAAIDLIISRVRELGQYIEVCRPSAGRVTPDEFARTSKDALETIEFLYSGLVASIETPPWKQGESPLVEVSESLMTDDFLVLSEDEQAATRDILQRLPLTIRNLGRAANAALFEHSVRVVSQGKELTALGEWASTLGDWA